MARKGAGPGQNYTVFSLARVEINIIPPSYHHRKKMKIVYMVCTTKTKACLKQATSTLTDKTDMEQGLSMLARDTLSRSEHDMKVAKKKYNYWRSGGAAKRWRLAHAPSKKKQNGPGRNRRARFPIYNKFRKGSPRPRHPCPTAGACNGIEMPQLL